MKVLATVRSYQDLHAALRARAHALKVTREELDSVTGLQSGYSGKLLSPIPIKAMGAMSLGPMLSALGLALVVVEDLEAVKRITSKMAKRRNAGGRLLAVGGHRKRRYPKLGKEWGVIMRARQVLLQSVTRRKQIARTAARARWGRS